VPNTPTMAVEVERTLVKSPPEIWDVLVSGDALSRWLGDIRVQAARAPTALEWQSDVARGVIELEASGWGTKVRAHAESGRDDSQQAEVAGRLESLLDDIGSSALTSS
jgi:hypothetical protein